MTENNDSADGGPGGIDWKREINAGETPLAELRQLVDRLEKLEAQGMAFGEWVFAVRTEQSGVEVPRTEMSKWSALMLSALASALATDISGRAIQLWSAAFAQRGEGAG